MSKKYNILIPDDLHINLKNFPSFHKFVAKTGSAIKFVREKKDWVDLYGNYDAKASALNEKARVLALLAPDVLFNYSVKGVNLFKVSRAEVLSKVGVLPDWYLTAYPETSEEIFRKLLDKNKRILMQCLAAAWDWVDYWSRLLTDEKLFSHCCVFSGSLIYQRSLIELLRYTPTKVMVMETSFTGNDYYCEEKYLPIANNCDIKHKAVFDSLNSEQTADDADKDRLKSINKVILSKNKNVVQPQFGHEITFSKEGKMITILGQVVNDFSLLEYKNVGISSIAFYEELIVSLARNGFNVVFKAHPWEEKKINVETSLTRDVLTQLTSKLSKEMRDRVVIVDHYPIQKLFDRSYLVVGLNSQGLIEAAFNGLKVAQFGDAFFGRKGFTHDYSLIEVDRFLLDLQNPSFSGTLDLEEYKAFEEFLRRFLQAQLISVYDSGVAKLELNFSNPSVITLAKQHSGTSKNISMAIENTSNINASAVVSPKTITSDPISSLIETKISNQQLEKRLLVGKKLRKFFLNPRKFFADSNRSGVRFLRHLFSHRA